MIMLIFKIYRSAIARIIENSHGRIITRPGINCWVCRHVMCAAVVERSRKSVHHHAGLSGRYMLYANLKHIELEGDIDI